MAAVGSDWQIAAVQHIVREKSSFVAAFPQPALMMWPNPRLMAADDLACLGFAVAHAIDSNAGSTGLSEEYLVAAQRICRLCCPHKPWFWHGCCIWLFCMPRQ
jgi:hypothetical protein